MALLQLQQWTCKSKAWKLVNSKSNPIAAPESACCCNSTCPEVDCTLQGPASNTL